MNNFGTIWRRELSASFLSPIAYVTMVVFLGVTNGTFLVAVLRNLGSYEPIAGILFAAIFLWLPILVTVTCMRLFAEEKRSGTIEALLTAPVTELEIVLGKYAAALSFTLLTVAPAVAAIFILERLSPGLRMADVDPGAIAAGCVILALLSAFLTAVGLLVSLLTKNQIVSAIACFCCVCTALMAGWLVSLVPGMPPELIQYISATQHIEEFTRGIVNADPFVLWGSGTVLLLFFAVRVLEARRWL